MTTIAEDYRILRNQVSKEIYNDLELKKLFQENNYDLVKCLLTVEERISGRKEYKIDNQNNLTETQLKLKELREIANSKDRIINNIKDRIITD